MKRISFIIRRNSFALSILGITGFIFSNGAASRATEQAEARNYLQYIPVTPFVGAEEDAKNYMRFREPVSAFKTTPHQPTWDEVMVYKQKLDLLREKAKEIQEFEMEKAPTPPAQPKISIPSDTSLPAPPLKLNSPNIDNATIDVTVSPWFNIQTPPPPVTTGPTDNVSTSNEKGQTSSQPEAPTPWVKTPVNGSDVYIPYSSLPGVNPPPAVTSPSAVIYSQPKAAGSQ